MSALTEAAAQHTNPVIIRSTPLLPTPRNNFIDDHIFARIEAAGIEPAPCSSDSKFLRRVTLDLTGKLPSLNEFTNFIEHVDAARSLKSTERAILIIIFSSIERFRAGPKLRIVGLVHVNEHKTVIARNNRMSTISGANLFVEKHSGYRKERFPR